MATITSRVPALIDYLVPLFTNAATLGAAADPNKVTVFDGPPTTELDPPLALYVGLSDPDNPGAEPAGDSAQSWGGLGRLARNETSTIHCCAQAWSGTDDLKTVRVSAYGIVAAVEVIMQSDTTQFGGNVLFPAPGITSLALLQNNTDKGAIARVAFDLIFQSRIGG
jgi:hypothetical protein